MQLSNRLKRSAVPNLNINQRVVEETENECADILLSFANPTQDLSMQLSDVFKRTAIPNLNINQTPVEETEKECAHILLAFANPSQDSSANNNTINELSIFAANTQVLN